MLTSGLGADTITGGSAGDSLSGGAGSDRLVGNAGNDWLNGSAGADTISGGTGTDTWQVDYGALTGATVNLVTQKATNGAVLSGIEALHYTGGIGADLVTTSAGVFNDTIYTGDGADAITTGRSSDVADGGGGNDALTGGADRDVFVFSNLGGAGLDRITDANAVDHDVIRLSGLTLGGIANGSGAGALGGEVQVSASLGVTTLHVGLDGAAGADFSVQLVGTFTAASFTVSGSDLML